MSWHGHGAPGVMIAARHDAACHVMPCACTMLRHAIYSAPCPHAILHSSQPAPAIGPPNLKPPFGRWRTTS